MAALVWFTMGVALWHFTVFVPDRFRGGIVGAFLGAAAGAMVSGAIAQIALGRSIGETDIATPSSRSPAPCSASRSSTRWACAKSAPPASRLGPARHPLRPRDRVLATRRGSVRGRT